jgi:uncharacterized Fe-S center protein
LAVGDDKFRALYPDVDGCHALDYAEELGMGHRDYELVNS